ncbi:aerolysin-like protein [Petromyzon marinus]|uniref:aerolysin-like protein n=1 Tax=Petromyzon marinus TaxID=7757 RepID=UPI003F712230
MSYPLTLHIIGGQGGNAFSFDGRSNAATLQKLSVSVGGWQVRGVEVWLTDGRRQKFGTVDSSAQQFEFQSGEFMSQLSLWGNGAGTRLGAIKFRTSRNREFFAKMTDEDLNTEFKIDVGSGVCLRVEGRSGTDIDCMGFLFLNAIKSSMIDNMNYPTMHQVIPNVQIEESKNKVYENDTTIVQSHTFQTSKKLTRTSSWSTILIPPCKTVTVVANIGRANIDLPYKALLRITCMNGALFDVPLSGVYKGLSYTKMTARATQS